MIKNKSKHYALVAVGVLCSGLTYAQESFNATGSNASGAGGNVAYSIGQVVYTTHTGSNGSVAQGVQHAYEIYTLGIKETEMNISLTAFPNPTTDHLILEIRDYKSEKVSYQLCDLQGKLISDEQITAKQTQINMSALPIATYFVNVINQDHKKVQTFKIIKN